MSGGLNLYGMITGIGDAFSKSYEGARKQAQEEAAPGLIADYVKAKGATATPASGGTLGTIAQSYLGSGGTGAADNGQPAQLPSFAGGGAAPMRMPGSGGEIETKFVDALKAGGLTNPFGLGAMAAYAGRESGYKGSNVTGSWSDPSESGQPGTSGGILSWRGDRFTNMQRMTAGAPDPVVAQAKYALTENPDLTMALQRAKSPEEANALMAQAWKFAGWDRQGGENAARLSSTQAYATSLGGGQGQQTGPGGSSPRPAATAAMSEDPDAANKPAPGMQPAGFVIPGQAAAPTPAQVASQGFAGFGSAASRMSDEQQAALQAMWKNPITRPVATAVYQELLTGKSSPWKMEAVNGVSAWVNSTDGKIIPITGVGHVKRDTATVGNTVIDTATGQPIYQAPEKLQTIKGSDGNDYSFNPLTGERKMLIEGKDDKYTYQNLPNVGMVALHPTDPDKSRVIIPGGQTRPLTEEERSAFRIGADQPAGMGADGKPFGIGGSKTEVNVETKGAGKFAEEAGKFQADRYGKMVDAADRAVSLRADIDTMAGFASQIGTGKLAEARLGLAQYAKDAGFTSIANSLVGGNIGPMEAFGALADKLTPQMRVPGSGSTSDAEGRAFKNSLPSLLKTPEGNAIIADTFRGMADHQAQAGEIAGKALRGEISQAEADQALRSMPSPFARFTGYQAAQKSKSGAATSLGTPKTNAGSGSQTTGSDPAAGAEATEQKDGQARKLPEVVKGGRPPDGYSWDSYLAGAKQKLQERPDLRPQLEERLAKAGIDPRKLGK